MENSQEIEQVKVWQKQKEMFDKFRCYYLYSFNKPVISLVGNLVTYELKEETCYGDIISYDELLERSLDNVSLLGEYTKASFLSRSRDKISFIEGLDSFDICCTMRFPKSDIAKHFMSGVERIYLPTTYHEIDAMVLSHEIVHFLKDSSLKEHRSKIYVEAIPIFLELLCLDEGKSFALEIFKRRNNMIRMHYEAYKCWNNIAENGLYYLPYDGSNGKHLEDFMCTKMASYIYSFYIAVLLYNQYKVNSKKVLELVRDVIEHRSDTLTMFGDSLKISNRYETFEKEYSDLKKVL